MIDRLHASLTRIVTPLIHYAATDVYLLCTLSNTARKRRQSTAACGPARLVRSHRLATWLPCGTRTCMRRIWMTSHHRFGFVRIACLVTVPTQFMNAAF